MRFLSLSVAVLASAASTVLASGDKLKIDVTHKVECERKTKSGDNIEVHYTGTLTDGTVFDSSLNRGQPIGFVVGTGRVIKGLVYMERCATASIGDIHTNMHIDGMMAY
jgi:FK506-binding protein 2